MSDRDSFTFYRKWHKLVANCDEKTQANIYKAIVDYVFSDTIPTDPTSQLMFSLIKQKLDEDAQRQAKTSKMRMRAALKKWGNSEEEIRKKLMQMQKKPCKCNETDANALQKRKKQFYEELIPYLSLYSAEMLRDFYEYWTEPNKSKTKFRKEMEKTWDTSRRLRTWAKRQNIYGAVKTNNSQEQRLSAVSDRISQLLAEDGNS